MPLMSLATYAQEGAVLRSDADPTQFRGILWRPRTPVRLLRRHCDTTSLTFQGPQDSVVRGSGILLLITFCAHQLR